jgi:hypothetical protein
MNNQDVQEAFESGERIDRAMDRAFFAAVRLHRLHGVPMALWEGGKVRQVDPFTIALPQEERTHAPEFGTLDARNGMQKIFGRDDDL